jgi:hypothetical protein
MHINPLFKIWTIRPTDNITLILKPILTLDEKFTIVISLFLMIEIFVLHPVSTCLQKKHLWKTLHSCWRCTTEYGNVCRLRTCGRWKFCDIIKHEQPDLKFNGIGYKLSSQPCWRQWFTGCRATMIRIVTKVVSKIVLPSLITRLATNGSIMITRIRWSEFRVKMKCLVERIDLSVMWL